MSMRIKVLGPGCRNCVTLDRLTRAAVADLGLDATVEKVEDYQAIMDYSLMSTPALVIDEQLILAGRVPKPAALRQILTEAASREIPSRAIPESPGTPATPIPTQHPGDPS
jgi:small redox-active disulfide protein 2